jgi:UMF1 family MFS transporter
MMCVDVERGRAEGIALARELEEMSKSQQERQGVLTEDLIDEIAQEQTTSYGTV